MCGCVFICLGSHIAFRHVYLQHYCVSECVCVCVRVCTAECEIPLSVLKPSLAYCPLRERERERVNTHTQLSHLCVCVCVCVSASGCVCNFLMCMSHHQHCCTSQHRFYISDIVFKTNYSTYAIKVYK